MSENQVQVRFSKFARDFNISINTIVDFLNKKGIKIDVNPNAKIPTDAYEVLLKEFQGDKQVKEESLKLKLDVEEKKTISIEKPKIVEPETIQKENEELLIKSKKIEPETHKVKVETSIETKELIAESKAPESIEITIAETVPEEEEKEIIQNQISETTETFSEEITSEEITSEENAIEDQIDQIPQPENQNIIQAEPEEDKEVNGPKIIGRINLDALNLKTKPAKKTKLEIEKERLDKKNEREEQKKKDKASNQAKTLKEEQEKIITTDKSNKTDEPNVVKTDEKQELYRIEKQHISSPKIVGKIDLPSQEKPKSQQPAENTNDNNQKKKKRKRISKETSQTKTDGISEADNKFNKNKLKPEINEEEIQKQIKETLARLSTSQKSKGAKHRRLKREIERQHQQELIEQQEVEKSVLKVTEFVTANELASMMNVQVNEIISMCLNLGLFVSINQRLDAETISIVTEELGYKVEFVGLESQEETEEDDSADNIFDRPPIVTVMGHVDHGKTKLLDFIRKTNVVAGEAGGITQHIGAYGVNLDSGKNITFLDTPGHEAFTAMRARGAKVTDIAIIIIAADDGVKPQTTEAINHAQAAGVPIIIAINKIDKPTANPEKVKEQLANINILVEDWGGKYQCQHIAAKEGVNIDKLLEKVLFEAELLALKANPAKKAIGTVIESSLDKGRGYVATVLVQNGTLHIGDVLIAGCHYGRIKAMYNERNQPIKEAGPSAPALILGLVGAPQAGDTFKVMTDEKEAKNIVFKRQQLQREQGLRTQKHITLDEIGRRIAIGDFKELNIIIKGDVDGSIEALADSLIKLSNPEVQVNVIHKSVGAISESDVMLASASNAVILGFQVRPSASAKKIAEQEQIDIRLYSIIYTAINEIKSAIEGMLSPDIEEKILCNIEVREVFKITKVGSVAGCFVLDGKVNRNTKIRVIRDGIVIYTGLLGSLKRFKDDVKEVSAGYECGLNIQSFNDIKTGDIIEGYEQIEVKRTL